MSTHQEEHVHIHEEEQAETRGSNPFVRVAIIIFIVLVLLFIAFSIVKFVPKIIGSFGTANVSFSSLFNPKDKITVSSTPAKVKTGSNFTVTWKNETTDTEGMTIWKYKCVQGVSIEYYSISGVRPVVCDTNFPLPAKGNSYSFIAKSTNKSTTVVPMTVSFWDADLKNMKYEGNGEVSILAEGSTETTTNVTLTDYEPSYVNNDGNGGSNTAATTTKNTNNTTNTSGTGTKNTTNTSSTNRTYTNGTADLRVSLSQIGRTRSDGAFEQTTSFVENDRVTVRFNVSNIGSARSGSWTLRADLPTKTQADRVYISKTQPALNPGDSYELTISFDAFDPNSKAVQITINAGDYNQLNNILSIAVSGNGSGSNNNSTGSKADLTVRIIDVGLMGNNNQFLFSNSLDENDTIAVKFEVENIGSKSSGTWRFEAELPTESNDTFKSNNQSSLAPGEKRQFTIGFDNPEVGDNDITIEVDSDDDVNENRENNNTDSEEVEIDD